MKPYTLLVLALVLAIFPAACANRPEAGIVAAAPERTAAPTFPSTSTSLPTLAATATNTFIKFEPTLAATATAAPTAEPSATPLPSPTPTQSSHEVLAQLSISPDWAGLQLPQDEAARWQAYAEGSAQLNPDEQSAVEEFITCWKSLLALVDKKGAAPSAHLVYRVRTLQDEHGGNHYVPYALDPGTAQIYTTVHSLDEDGKDSGLGLWPAPLIPGMTQQVSADGRMVEYLDSKGRVLLLVDAVRLSGKNEREKFVAERLADLYGTAQGNSPAMPARKGSTPAKETFAVYPRYHFPVAGVEAGFYGIEKSLTASQVVQLKCALEQFDRPDMEGLKQGLFHKNFIFLAPPSIGGPAGQTFIGTGVVELDRRYLFSNKYDLASTLAHEAAHAVQAEAGGDQSCAALLRYEVGNQKVPADFFDWDAEKLLAAIKDGSIGSYHVSAWTLHHMGISGSHITWLIGVINSGTADGRSLLLGNCAKK
jgi:hypothetical protein